MFTIFRRYFVKEAKNIPFEFLDAENYEATVDNSIKIGGLYNAYYEAYNQIGLIHGKRIGKGINRDIKNFDPMVFTSEYQRQLFNWILDNVGYRIVSVRGDFVKYIQGLLADGLVQGKTMRETAIEIEKLINRRNFYRWQALRIARTESTAAANRAAVISGSTTGIVLEKVWISGKDARVRRLPDDAFDHTLMDGKKVDEKGFFAVPGKFGVELLEYPGAPVTKSGAKSSGANVIQCRCTAALVPKRDANGRIMRTGQSPRPTPRLNPNINPNIPNIPLANPTVRPTQRGFVPAKSVQEVESRLKRFAPNIDFKGLSLDKQNEILNGIEDVLGKYNVTLRDTIGFQTKRSSSLGVAGRDFDSNPLYIKLQKTFVKSPDKEAIRTAKVFKASKQNRITKWQSSIDRGDRPEQLVSKLKENISKISSADRWAIYQDSGRPLYTTTVHEAYHSVYYKYKLETEFANQLKRFHVTPQQRFSVSEYGASKTSELWAEVGASVESNVKIPDNILNAFIETIKTIKL